MVTMESLGRDLAFGWRALRRRPGFTTAALATLALGIGATSAVFGVIHATLLRPLPFPDPGRLVRLEEMPARGGRLNLPGATLAAVRERARSLAAVGAFRAFPLNLAGEGPAEAVTGARVTDGYFAALGGGPVAGRLFLQEEFAPGAERVAVLREGLWRRRFGADPSVVGRVIRLDGEGYRVVGVFPERLAFPDFADLWLPMDAAGTLSANRVSHLFTTLARVRPDVPLAAARAELASLAPGIPHDEPFRLAATPLQERLTESARPALLALSGAVVLLLVVACANVATLLLARGEQRAREMAVRAALGAGARRLAGQMLAESLLLGLLAAPLGLALSLALERLFARLAPASLRPPDGLAIEPATAAFAALVALGTAVLFGLWPARQAARADLRRPMAARSGRTARAMVVAEVALLVVLLGAAAMLARSSLALLRVPLGFSPEGVLTFYVSPDGKAYPDARATVAYVDTVVERLRALPGARLVAASSALPTTGLPSTSFALDGREDGDATADVIGVGPEYFRLLRIPLVGGRTFGEQDRLGAPVVVVLSRAAATAFWPGVDPIGHRLTMLHWNEPLSAEVVGVVEDVRQRGPDRDVEPAVYFSHRQFADRALGWYFEVHTDADPQLLVPALRPTVAAVDPDQPADSIRTLAEVMSAATEARRFQAALFGTLAAIAFALVVAGLHGVLGRRVAERKREIGVRLALGARPDQVLRLVIADGVEMAALGLLLGLPAAIAAARVLASLLDRVGPIDLGSTAGVAGAVAVLAAAGSWIPARRASRVDASVCLRDE